MLRAATVAVDSCVTAASRPRTNDPAMEFRKLIKSLSELAEESLAASVGSGKDLDGVLIQIAIGMKHTPEKFLEIEREYLDPRATNNRSQTVQQVKQEQRSKEYRTCWEFVALCPESSGALAGHTRLAIGLLSEINDNRSLLPLLYLFRLTTQNDVNPDRVDGWQGTLFLYISGFKSKEGLAGIFDCYNLVMQQRKKFPTYKPQVDFRKSILDQLRPENLQYKTRRDEWKQIVLKHGDELEKPYGPEIREIINDVLR
ncbi:MAG: hypothetical protein HY286_19635 [Planctomycetes bacterium]|nr:hypothetical protein [Planctomycetota bacterium]